MSLDTIINVQIDRQTTVPSRAGFGTPLVVGQSNKLTSKVETFTSLDAVASVFADTDPEYIAAARLFGQTLSPTQIKIGYRDPVETFTSELNAIEQFDPDWYCLISDSRVDQDILDAAAWTESRKKIYLAASADADIFDGASTTDIAYQLKALSYDRTALLALKGGVDEFPEAAWAGGILPLDPGSVSWKFKTLTGVTVETLTDNEKTVVLRNEAGTAKNANTYTRVGGVNITEEGNMVSGEFIDVMRGVDFIAARIQERVYFQMVNLPKIPYTNDGVAIITNEIEAVMQTAIGQSILRADPQPEVSAPDVQDVDPIDRGNRLLPDVTFEGQLAGAIHKTTIRGVVTL